MSCVHGIVVGFSVCVNDYDLKFRILDLREKPAMAQGSRFSRPIPPSQFFGCHLLYSSDPFLGLHPESITSTWGFVRGIRAVLSFCMYVT